MADIHEWAQTTDLTIIILKLDTCYPSDPEIWKRGASTKATYNLQ